MRIKSQIKQFGIRAGVWYPLEVLRSIPATMHWLGMGCRGPVPHPVKMRTVLFYLREFSIDDFVETGTYLGDTLGYIARRGAQCISVELSKELYEAACARFQRYPNVRLVQGDSGQILPELLKNIKKPALFWLDGHYSAGVTACAGTHTPISAELQAILNHPINRHVILIDDARLFDGTNDYPQLDSLLQKVRQDGSYVVEVSADIIRLTPRTHDGSVHR